MIKILKKATSVAVFCLLLLVVNMLTIDIEIAYAETAENTVSTIATPTSEEIASEEIASEEVTSEEVIEEVISEEVAEEVIEEVDPAVLEVRAKLSSIEAINKDALCWLQIESIELNQPVVYSYDEVVEGADPLTADEGTKYLKLDSDGVTYANAGTCYVSTFNKDDLSDTNIVIFGHNMRNNTMFGRLDEVAEGDIITIVTDSEVLQYQVFTNKICPLYDENGNRADYMLPWSNTSWDSSLLEDDQVLTLVTCHGQTERTVVQAVLIK